MFKWLLSKWYKHSPICNCGWTMKPTKARIEEYSWMCVWNKCGWETYQTYNGKLHWFKKKLKKNEKSS